MIKKKNPGHQSDNQGFNASGETSDTTAAGGMGDGNGVNMSDGEAPGDIPAGGADSGDAAEWKDKYMRLSAEFDNFRKRTLREKMEIMAYGGKDVIADILPVLDDIDRALEAARTVEDIESVRTGTELIAQKLKGVMQGKGLKEIQAVGEQLDTDFHEAVAKVPTADAAQKGRIVDVVQKGYMLKDNVIRHAKVVVGE